LMNRRWRKRDSNPRSPRGNDAQRIGFIKRAPVVLLRLGVTVVTDF